MKRIATFQSASTGRPIGGCVCLDKYPLQSNLILLDIFFNRICMYTRTGECMHHTVV